MNISYKVEDESFKVTFCPDNQGLNLKKKNHSYMQISKDLKKLNHDQKVFKDINNAISRQSDPWGDCFR